MQISRSSVLVVLVSLFISLLAFSALHAEPANEAEALARGRAHVEKTCVGCHAGPQLDVVVGRRLEARDVEPIDVFLATHHVPDEAIRADVVAYLTLRLANPSSKP